MYRVEWMLSHGYRCSQVAKATESTYLSATQTVGLNSYLGYYAVPKLSSR